MSDETPTPTNSASANLYEHYCEHPDCKKWGGLGYDIGKGETRWYCFEHKWAEYPLAKGGKTF